MTDIFSNGAATRDAVALMIDDSVIGESITFTFTDADVGGVRQVTANWTACQIAIDKISYTVAAGSILINSGHVASPTTYYVYMDATTGTLTPTASTTNPAINPLVDEYILGAVIRFKSAAGVLTVYWSKQPNQDGIYEMVHNLKEDSIFYNPIWIGGLAATMSAGGKVSTTMGYVRFPGNEPREPAAITEGLIVLEDESATHAGIDTILTYADGSAITAGKYHKLLLGVLRDKAGYNTTKYVIVRQAKPSVEYTSCIEADVDALSAAATGFPGAYLGAVTPLYYICTLKGDYTDGSTYPAGYLVDIRANGPAKGAGGSAATSHHALADLTNFDDHTQYIPADGSRPLTGNWTAAKNISTVGTLTGSTLVSTLASGGAAPMTITSTTKVTNLNADQLDGYDATAFALLSGATMAGNLAMGGKDITGAGDVGSATVTATGLAKADTFQSTHAIGVAPIAVTSTTMCTNLNADAVDGVQGANIVTADGLTALTGNWDAGKKITVTTLESTVATGTAPFVVASETAVAHLNASFLGGVASSGYAAAAKGVTNGDTHDHVGGDGAQIDHSGLANLTTGNDHTQYLLKDGSVALTGNWTTNTKNITTTGVLSGSQLTSTIADGTAPLVITSKTVTSNLNADMLDGLHDTSFLKADGTVTLTGNLAVQAAATIDGVDISAHAIANPNAHHNAVTLDTDADTLLSLSTQALGLDTQTANRVLAGPTTGAAAVPTFRALVAADIDIARTEGTLTLTDGQNDNVALTDGVNEYVVTGPTNAFGFSGFTGGYGGRVITILNNTIAKNMTAYHATTSSAANQIWCSGTLANTATANQGAMVFRYFATLQKWVLVSLVS